MLAIFKLSEVRSIGLTTNGGVDKCPVCDRKLTGEQAEFAALPLTLPLTEGAKPGVVACSSKFGRVIGPLRLSFWAKDAGNVTDGAAKPVL